MARNSRKNKKGTPNFRIALAQINPTVGDLSGNKKKIVAFSEEAVGKNADVVVFPELAICGYPPEDLLMKGHFVRDTKSALESLTRMMPKITAVVGFVEKGFSSLQSSIGMQTHDFLGPLVFSTNLPGSVISSSKLSDKKSSPLSATSVVTVPLSAL